MPNKKSKPAAKRAQAKPKPTPQERQHPIQQANPELYDELKGQGKV